MERRALRSPRLSEAEGLFVVRAVVFTAVSFRKVAEAAKASDTEEPCARIPAVVPSMFDVGCSVPILGACECY